MLGIVIYNDSHFKNNPLPLNIVKQINQKKYQLQKIVKEKYNINFNIPILISDKMPNNLFGLAVYTQKHEIKIVLNKNRFKESVDYMIDFVLPHEYAHAVMFKLGKFKEENEGHSKQWQQICLTLGGKQCDRYVNHKDVIYGKIPF